jgi:ubiquinol-cytochrome c reductase iron-sulfur subunit
MTGQETPSKTGDARRSVERRDFLYIATGAAGVVGSAFAAWPFIDTMNPSADVLALSSIEVDLAGIEVGQRISVKWRGRPVFIAHRTEREIAEAEADDGADLPDPEADSVRVQRAEWLIAVGVCTHLGCIPSGQSGGQARGEWQGWFCPCHGSHYDTSGRIRKGPAPRNLDVPEYAFVDELMIKIG